MIFRAKRRDNGFTLVELLVVIAIISLLSSIALASLNQARAKAHDAYRKSSMEQVQLALYLYHDTNNSYPSTGGAWWGLSVNGGSRTTSGPNAYIPELTPTYISTLPADPKGDLSGWSGFLYRSDGINYKLLSHSNGPESFPSVGQAFYDPARPGLAWMVCSGDPTACTW